jgi:hypothetical protein
MYRQPQQSSSHRPHPHSPIWKRTCDNPPSHGVIGDGDATGGAPKMNKQGGQCRTLMGSTRGAYGGGGGALAMVEAVVAAAARLFSFTSMNCRYVEMDCRFDQATRWCLCCHVDGPISRAALDPPAPSWRRGRAIRSILFVRWLWGFLKERGCFT